MNADVFSSDSKPGGRRLAERLRALRMECEGDILAARSNQAEPILLQLCGLLLAAEGLASALNPTLTLVPRRRPAIAG